MLLYLGKIREDCVVYNSVDNTIDFITEIDYNLLGIFKSVVGSYTYAIVYNFDHIGMPNYYLHENTIYKSIKGVEADILKHIKTTLVSPYYFSCIKSTGDYIIDLKVQCLLNKTLPYSRWGSELFSNINNIRPEDIKYPDNVKDILFELPKLREGKKDDLPSVVFLYDNFRVMPQVKLLRMIDKPYKVSDMGDDLYNDYFMTNKELARNYSEFDISLVGDDDGIHYSDCTWRGDNLSDFLYTCKIMGVIVGNTFGRVYDIYNLKEGEVLQPKVKNVSILHKNAFLLIHRMYRVDTVRASSECHIKSCVELDTMSIIDYTKDMWYSNLSSYKNLYLNNIGYTYDSIIPKDVTPLGIHTVEYRKGIYDIRVLCCCKDASKVELIYLPLLYCGAIAEKLSAGWRILLCFDDIILSDTVYNNLGVLDGCGYLLECDLSVELEQL